jgi:ATP-dependent DNA helicase RecG
VNLHALLELVAQGESERIEFKRSTGQRTEGVKTVCGMLNGLGGFLLFGVTNDGQVSGQEVSSRTLEDIGHELQRVEPPAFPDIETVALESGNSVIALRVPGGGGPYTYDGRPYLRQGPTTRVMPRQRYERMLLERMHSSHRWENQQAHDVRISDLDHAEIIRTIEEAIRRGRMEDPGIRDLHELLLGLNLIHHDQILNAAVVLFGKDGRLMPQFPQCLLRLARFRGNDKTEFIDSRQESGHAFALFQRAQRFLRDHLPVAGRIVPNLFERVDDPLYPLAALREALANALCHRDYSIGGGAVSIAIYDDRLEIASTGILPFDLTIDDLMRPHASRPWNPLIAQTFYRRGLIESWGRGTLKIVELTEQAGLVQPEFECRSGEVVVRFFPTRYVPPTRVGHDLSPLQRALLQILDEVGPTPLKQIRSYLPAPSPERTVQDNLQLLRRLGLADVSGQGRGARWALRGTAHENLTVETDV